MASKLLSSQTVKATRGFAAQAAAKQSPAAEPAFKPREAVKTTTLGNGIVVTSIETNAPLTRVGIAFKAGSRNEPAGKEGLVHVMRMASSLTNKKSTSFGLTRALNQSGAALTCTSGREHILYTVDVSRQNLDAPLAKLADAATQQVFKPWELKDNKFRINLDLAALDPQTTVMELLHQVAFRNGLANSLYCPAHNVGKHCSDTLNSWVGANLRADNAAVVGVGVQHDRLVAYAQNLGLKAGQASSLPASKVHGGEIRVERGGPLAIVALAAPGAALSDTKGVLAMALVQRILGTGTSVKWGMGAGSKLSQAGANGAAINLNYTDAGLFGVVVEAPASEAGKAVSAAAKALRSVKVTDGLLARAKAQLKADLLMAEENTGELLQELALQSLVTKSQVPLADILATVNKMTVADLNGVASQLASAKLAVAAVGSLSQVPHADEL